MKQKPSSRAGRKPRFNEARREVYLNALAETGIIGEAMKACGIKSRATIKAARDSDPYFAQAEAEALEAAGDRIEQAVLTRALYGQEVAVVDEAGAAVLDPESGQPKTVILPPDNKMLLAMAKAVRPRRYATERRQVTSNTNATTVFMPAEVLEEEFERMLDAQRQKTKEHFKQEGFA